MTEEQIQQIYAWWNIFQRGDRLTEIRIIGKYTFSGYYRNVENLIRDVSAHECDGAVYFIINDPLPACYDRAQKEMMSGEKKLATTSDKDIQGYQFVFLDLDVNGVTGVNSTDQEKALALKKTREIFRFLRDEGFNLPIVTDSANGYHLYIPCSLANNEENRHLIKRFTLAMGMIFSDENVKIDPVVANPARIAKLPGTFSFKGSAESVERPRRMCRILSSPGELKANDRAYFEKIAALYPEEEKPSQYNNFSTGRFDLDDFIARHGIQVTQKLEVADGTRYILDHCLFNENHKGKDAVLFQHRSGAVAYYCYHASCAGNDWHRLREMLEPGCYDQRFGSPRRRMVQLNRDALPPALPQLETDDKGPKWKRMSMIPKPEFDATAYIPSGIRQIDDLIVGWKRKQVTLWSGYRGAAKSTLLSQLILNAANQGYKSAVWTGELDGPEFKTWLYLQASGKGHNQQSKYSQFYYTPKGICEKIDPWIDRYLWLYNNEYSDNYDQLEREIRELVLAEKIDQVFLDNLTILDIDALDDNIYAAQKLFMKRVHNLAIELNIHIHCVAHPNKSGGFLRMNSISGTGHLPDIAQNVCIIHKINRDFEASSREFLAKATVQEILDSGCTNCVEICKCRDKGSATDTFIKLWFEFESNRLKNSIAENIRYGWEDEAGMPPPPPEPELKDWAPGEINAWIAANHTEDDLPY